MWLEPLGVKDGEGVDVWVRREENGRAHAHDNNSKPKKITKISEHGSSMGGMSGAWMGRVLQGVGLVRRRKGGVYMRVMMMLGMQAHVNSQRSHV